MAGEAEKSQAELREGVMLRPRSLLGVISHSSSAERLEGVAAHSSRLPDLCDWCLQIEWDDN